MNGDIKIETQPLPLIARSMDNAVEALTHCSLANRPPHRIN